MKIYNIILFIPILLLLSCSESNPTEPEFNNPKNLYIADLRESVDIIDLLLDNTVAGSAEGQYPSAECTSLQDQLKKARDYLINDLPLSLIHI